MRSIFGEISPLVKRKEGGGREGESCSDPYAKLHIVLCVHLR